MTTDGAVALVTGGASGIGLATARRLGWDGARVVILDRRAEPGRLAEADLRDDGIDVTFLVCDVTLEDQVRRSVAEAESRFGPITVLVNNAAVFEPTAFLEAATSEWRRAFEVIVQGAYLCSREVARRMIANRTGGAIVNISSINGSRALADASSYNAGKGALDQLTRCLALELADFGIRVNSVAPGFVNTPMSIVDGDNELETDEFRGIYTRGGRIPMRRAASPEEIASVVAFLVGPDSSYICGAIVPVDGGLAITF